MTGTDHARPGCGPVNRHYTLGALTLVYLVNFLDRGLIGLLLEPIKLDLALSDTQLGFLTGIAFAIFYAMLGVPIARWSDRGNRVTIASFALTVWGGAMMLCLFVGNFVHLLIARIAAAIGEAGGMPPTYSLVGDYFPAPAERNRAMAIYLAGGPISSVLSFMFGGWLNERIGWRLTFFVMGLVGLIIAVIVRFTVRETRPSNEKLGSSIAQTSSWKVLRSIFRHGTSRHLALGIILLWTLGLGMAPWYGAFLIRTFNVSTGELGLWLGLVFGVGGVVGLLSGGLLTARLFPENERAQLNLSAAIMICLLPSSLLFLFAPFAGLSLAGLFLLVSIFSFMLAPLLSLLQRLSDDRVRATSFALVMLISNLVGMGLGPQLVGLGSDLFAASFHSDSLRYSMALLSLSALWAAIHFRIAAKHVISDLARVAELNARKVAL